MKTITCILLALLATGCSDGAVYLTKESEDAHKNKVKATGDARIAVFKECMVLAANMPRQSDDDVADIVSQCSNQAYYLTNYILK